MNKEQIEQVAREYATQNAWYPGETSYESDIRAMEKSFADAFKAGAEWMGKQSPWISVKDKPKESGWVFVAGGMNAYRALFYCAGKFYSDVSLGTYDSGVTHWMPIPWLEDFNNILDANKDVLKRIKENGD